MATPIRGMSPMDTPIERRKRRWWPIAIGAAAVLVVAGFLAVPLVHRWAHGDHVVERERLRLGTVVRGDLVHDVAAQGRVVAASRPTLFSPAAGIVSLLIRDGQAVAKGDRWRWSPAPSWTTASSRSGRRSTACARAREGVARK